MPSMSGRQRSRPKIDATLLIHVAALPAGGQRWLKTALQAIAASQPLSEAEEKGKPPGPRRQATRPRRRPDLDEVLSGEADLRKQANAYPELAEELHGIADIADLLREAGREHRSLGDEILRESESESESESDSESDDESEDEEEGAG